MQSFLLLLRGINVGGKNIVPMAALRTSLEELGHRQAKTYIASGNVVLQSNLTPAKITTQVERMLLNTFSLDSSLIKVLVLNRAQLQKVVSDKPAGFGEKPQLYHSDVIFLIGIDVAEALPVFKPREGVDTIWPGSGVIYSQRLSAQRTKSRLSKIVGTVPYQSMTIRTWRTTTTLLSLLEETEKAAK